MPRRVGLKTFRHGWMDPFYRKPSKPTYAPAPVLTPEEEEQRRVEKGVEILAFIERKTAESNAYFDQVRASRGLEKIADREARIAVEGDTDLNHDNVEAAE